MMDSSIVSSTKLQIAAEEFYFHQSRLSFSRRNWHFWFWKRSYIEKKTRWNWKNGAMPRFHCRVQTSRRFTVAASRGDHPHFGLWVNKKRRKYFCARIVIVEHLSVLLILIIIVVAVINDRRDRPVKSRGSGRKRYYTKSHDRRDGKKLGEKVLKKSTLPLYKLLEEDYARVTS